MKVSAGYGVFFTRLAGVVGGSWAVIGVCVRAFDALQLALNKRRY